MYLLIVTGLSGAGKSLALRCLEEQGFYCVDNLPSQLLNEFVTMCGEASPKIERAAVTIDSRESLLSRSAESIQEHIDALNIRHHVLFLDCRDDVLQKRYNEVRRRHPLGEAGDAATGVQRERRYLEIIREHADFILDTSDVAPRSFHSLMEKILPEYQSETITLLCSSFGYKRGVPVDADIVLDMRFLPNPFYVPELREKSGLDKEVYDYVFSTHEATAFMDTLEISLSRLLPYYLNQGKTVLRVCFGCTGGRHRSVAAAEELAARFAKRGVDVRIFHRDLVLEARDIQSRFNN